MTNDWLTLNKCYSNNQPIYFEQMLFEQLTHSASQSLWNCGCFFGGEMGGRTSHSFAKIESQNYKKSCHSVEQLFSLKLLKKLEHKMKWN